MNDNFGVLARNPDWETKLILNRIRNAQALRELTNEQNQQSENTDDTKAGKDKKTVSDSEKDIERRIRDILAMETSLRKRGIPR